MPKVRGGDRERQAVMAQEWPRRAVPCMRSGVVAGEELPHIRGQGQRLKGATPHSRTGGVTSSKVRSSGCTLLEQL